MNIQELHHSGIDRLQYFLAHIAMIAVVVFVVMVFGPESRVMNVATLLLMIASLVLDVLRLRNMGVSQWWALLRYVPFGGSALAMGLLCAQKDWADTYQLDTTGKRILFVEILWIALMLYLIFRTHSRILEILF